MGLRSDNALNNVWGEDSQGKGVFVGHPGGENPLTSSEAVGSRESEGFCEDAAAGAEIEAVVLVKRSCRHKVD